MDNEELIELVGTVSEIKFFNEENGYTVLTMETDSGEIVTVTGCLPFASLGEQMIVSGNWTRHPSHGKQFSAVLAQRRMPKDAEGVYAYLASRTIKGIGPATAAMIVSAFGERSLDVIENTPEKLVKLKGITMKKALEFSEALRQQTGLRHLMEFLAAHGVKPQYAMRLYRAYGDRALDVLNENPYILATQFIGGSFADADSLALELGTESDSAERVAAAILFELRHNTGNGHVFIPREKLIAATAQLIRVESETVSDGLDVLMDSGEVISAKVANVDACYLSKLYEAERYTAERLLRTRSAYIRAPIDLDDIISYVERRQGVVYAPMQRKTLEIAAANRVMVITGGPGTGKTTTVRAIIEMFERMNLTVLLAAPTGRAAKRMTELAGREAVTIHRLLEAAFSEDGFEPSFQRNENKPLNCSAMIVDECSMIDVLLMKALLAALPNDCRLVLVGDADQLPPVGPGNVFMDILRSNAIPSIRLTEVFRQTADSRIVRYAHQINIGEHPNLSENDSKGDFFFLQRAKPEEALALVVSLCEKRLPQKMGIPSTEIQVLTPTRKGLTGVASLNAALQNALNPQTDGKTEKTFGQVVFRTGDRVMQIRNNYDIIWTTADETQSGSGVYNGDVGYILSIDLNQELLTVDYDGRLAVYGFDMLGELEHAWAMTVHKSQGSEYRAVILCMTDVPPQLSYRGVLYTAVTRAKEILIAIGEEAVVHRMIDNDRQVRRYSGLRARLAGEVGEPGGR